MIDTTPSGRERLDELLADRCLFGLSEVEDSELDRLSLQFPDVDAEQFERIAAAVDLALAPGPSEPLPEKLHDAVRARAAAFSQHLQHPAASAPRSAGAAAAVVSPRRSYREALAWLLAVSALVAAAVVSFGRSPANPGDTPSSAAHLRGQMLEATYDVIRVDWQTTGDPAANVATGDVVWSTSAQRGFMRFSDLGVNEPTKYQYQLWIFDAERDDRYPVDGGVFDINTDRTEAVVPIQAKLKVGRPVMFAVTVEQPGGAVVSSRERICLVAKLDG